MRRSTTAVMATGLAGAFFIAAPSLGGPAFDNKYEDTSQVDECRDSQDNVVGTVTYGGPEYMWPPNHKMQPISIVAADVDAADADNDMVSLAVEAAHDEIDDETGEEMNGSGNTEGDFTVAGGDTAEDASRVDGEARSERSGRGDGRTYTFNYQAEFADGAQDADGYGEVTCTGSFEITVPHDMRGGAGWKHDTDGDGQGDNGNGNGRDNRDRDRDDTLL